jgi:hypothetical protein
MALLSVRKLADEFAVRRRRALFEGILAGTLFGTAAILIRLLTDIDVFYTHKASYRHRCFVYSSLAIDYSFLGFSCYCSLFEETSWIQFAEEQSYSSSLLRSFIRIALCTFCFGGYGYHHT